MNPAVIAALITAAGSVAGGMMSQNPKESGTQKQKRKLIDELMASISGNGQYSDMFQMDEAAFQKSFVDPAKARFNNQIAPQIQQNYIAGGQQRGTGSEDTLSRAGVDMDQMLNEQYMKFQQGAMDRKSSTLNSIIGGGEGVVFGMSTGEKAQDAAAGYLSSDDFGSSIRDILKAYNGDSSDDSNEADRKDRKSVV